MKRELGFIQVAAEVSLLGVTLATVFAFNRLFIDSDYAGPLVAAAIGSHLVAAVARRLGWGVGRAAIVSIIALGLVITWFMFWDTSLLGIPTGSTLDSVQAAADQAWRQFREVVAPAPTFTGFVLALAVGVWAGAFLADWAAFRLWSPVEAIVPMAALFVFGALLGADAGQISATVLFVAAVTAFELLHRVARQAREGRWVNDEIDRGINALVVRGAVIGLGAVAIGSLLAPALPMADDPAVVDWRGGAGEDSERKVPSPLVTIEDRLVEQSDIELFTVQAEEPAYWRLTSLDIFDGGIWKSNGSFEKASGALPRAGTGEPEGTTVKQSYAVSALSSPWLPAAFEPLSFTSESTDAVYEPASATLIVPHDRDDADGAEYAIESVRPTFTAEQLRTDRAARTGISDRFLQLPPDFSQYVADQAALVTAEGATDYDKALLLQNWFRDEFDYDLDIDLDHDMDAMEAFLDQRRGYCQQFAGTYAAMARSLGIPSRVAVGFTWGERDAVDPTLWHVSGRQAHAWVEVYLPGAGWVDFDPTPGRGAPGSAAWTDNDAEQDVGSAEQQTDSTPTTVAATPEAGEAEPTAEELAEQEATTGTAADGSSSSTGSRALPLLAVTLGVVLTAVAAAGGFTALVKIRRRHRRRRLLADLIEEVDESAIPESAATGPGDPPDQGAAALDTRPGIEAAWAEVVDQLGVFGLEELPTETQSEFVDRATAVTELDSQAPSRLAARVDEAEFGRRPPSVDALHDARTTMAAVDEHVSQTTTRWDRFLRLVDPRPLLARSARRS